MKIFDYLNPFHYVSPDNYSSFWQMLFTTLLQGFWSRTFAVFFLFLTYWYGVRRRNIRAGILFYIIALTITYLGGFLKYGW